MLTKSFNFDLHKTLPLSSKVETCQTVGNRFWYWLPDETTQNLYVVLFSLGEGSRNFCTFSWKKSGQSTLRPATFKDNVHLLSWCISYPLPQNNRNFTQISGQQPLRSGSQECGVKTGASRHPKPSLPAHRYRAKKNQMNDQIKMHDNY